jgi:hypothetical protein
VRLAKLQQQKEVNSMGHVTQAKELLEKQPQIEKQPQMYQPCKHKRVAFIVEEHKLIPQGYAWLSKQESVDLESFETICTKIKNICLDCGLQLD